MTTLKHVKPKAQKEGAPPLKVPLPHPKKGYLPPEGANVDFDLPHWRRRFKEGDIEVGPLKPEEEPAAAPNAEDEAVAAVKAEEEAAAATKTAALPAASDKAVPLPKAK